ncbi:MAG: helix-turn-helix domain-containing protein [Polyangiaceae bacterium]|nr:helix-turn-helix domain-containing protein [Polyangiaceae bacterium]
MNCPICDGQMVPRGYEHTTVVGTHRVVDSTAMVPQCEKCGAADLDFERLGRYERRAALIVLLEAKTVGGKELRFARKTLGLRQEDLARALECNPQQVSRWEHDETIDMRLRLSVAALIERVEHGKPLDDLAQDDRPELRVA